MSGRSRLMLVLVFVGAGTLVWWLQRPTETEVRFVLTHLEVRGADGLYRHERLRRLDCTVESEDGTEVARIVHRRPGAVSHPTRLRLPSGRYRLTLLLQFDGIAGEPFSVRLQRSETLEGGEKLIRLE